jgi:hypothetical protein
MLEKKPVRIFISFGENPQDKTKEIKAKGN